MSARYRRRPLSVPPPADDALSHGMAMAAVPVVFGALGWLLDSQVGTGPVFLIVFAFFGVASSFASAYYRYSSRIERVSEGKPWRRSGAAAGRPGGRSEVDQAEWTRSSASERQVTA